MRYSNPWLVAAGAIAALWAVTVIAVAAGSQLGRFLSDQLLNRVSAGLFFVVGVIVVVTAVA